MAGSYGDYSGTGAGAPAQNGQTGGADKDLSTYLFGQSKWNADPARLDTRKGDVDLAHSSQVRDQQGQLTGTLQNWVAGNGPSVAQQQLWAGERRAAAQARGLAGAASGPMAGLATRQAMYAGNDAAMQTNEAAAALRAQEQQQAAALLQQNLYQQRLQDLQSRGMSIDEATALLNAQTNLQGTTASVAMNDATNASHGLGGLLGAVGAGAAMLSDERDKTSVKPLDVGGYNTGERIGMALGAFGAGIGGGPNVAQGIAQSNLEDRRRAAVPLNAPPSAPKDSGGGPLAMLSDQKSKETIHALSKALAAQVSLPPQRVEGYASPAPTGVQIASQHGTLMGDYMRDRATARDRYELETRGQAAYAKLTPAQQEAFWQETPEQRHAWFAAQAGQAPRDDTVPAPPTHPAATPPAAHPAPAPSFWSQPTAVARGAMADAAAKGRMAQADQIVSDEKAKELRKKLADERMSHELDLALAKSTRGLGPSPANAKLSSALDRAGDSTVAALAPPPPPPTARFADAPGQVNAPVNSPAPGAVASFAPTIGGQAADIPPNPYEQQAPPVDMGPQIRPRVARTDLAPGVQAHDDQASMDAFQAHLDSILGGYGKQLSDKETKEAFRKMATSPDANRKALDPVEPFSFRYKDGPAREMSGGNPAAYADARRERAGVMAQDMERSPAGEHVVEETPMGKALDMQRALGFALAANAGLDKRVRKLEARKGA